MTLKTIGHLFYVLSSFMHHFAAISEFQFELQSGNAQIAPVTMKFQGWHWKLVGHLFYTNSSLMHHFIAIGGFRFELLFGNAQIGSNLTIFCPHVTLTFYGWPRKTIGYLFYTYSSFMHHCIAFSEFRFDLQPGNVQIGSNWKIFCHPWPSNFTDDLEKQ